MSLYKVGMPWPLEPTGLRAFAGGLETLMVVEHKRPLLETQARAALYDLPAHAQPKVIGKVDEQGHPLLSELGALSVAEVALAIADRLPPGPHMERVHAYLDRVSAAGMAAVSLGADQIRKPFFCSGCPHNTSTRLPEGSRALAGIGCHYMASFSDPNTDLTSHMGAEGLTWAGASSFTSEKHVFVNLGDGTYNHSGSLAIRGSIAMGSTITYKLLFNDAVAMTGGQKAESGFTVPQITRQLASEGVKTIVVRRRRHGPLSRGDRPRAGRFRATARRARRRAARASARPAASAASSSTTRSAPTNGAGGASAEPWPRRPSASSSTPACARAAAIAQPPPTAFPSSRWTPNTAASGGSTSRPATRTIPASMVSAPRS